MIQIRRFSLESRVPEGSFSRGSKGFDKPFLSQKSRSKYIDQQKAAKIQIRREIFKNEAFTSLMLVSSGTPRSSMLAAGVPTPHRDQTHKEQ